jgi:AcrR family transcriptional regulator
MTHRAYQQRKRAERQEETRRRILAAAMELHGTVGPLATTVSAVAELAGVERLTVYRHFPTTRELFHGCGALFMETYPLPALLPERPPADPSERVRAVLRRLYAYFRDRHDYFTVFLRDLEQVPDLQELMAGTVGREMSEAAEWLVGSFGDVADPVLLGAVIGQAMDFWGWRSWMQQRLDDPQIIDLVARMAAQVARTPRPAGAL